MDNAKNKQPEQMISSYVGKILRDNFGKGPEAVFVSFGDKFVTIYLRNFFSQIDKILQDQDQDEIICDIREKVMITLAPQIKMYIEMVTENTIVKFYYDWSLHNKTGMLVGIAEEPFKNTETLNSQFEGKEELECEVIRLSEYAQKVPDKIISYQINSRTIVVIRKNVTLMLEKELIRRGYSELLKTVKRNLEKRYLYNSVNFENILKRKVVDIFADWDYELDKSIFVIIVNPNEKVNIP